MYYRIKNTLAGLAVATAILGLSWSVGRPPIQTAAGQDFSAGALDVPGIQASIDVLEQARKRNRGMRSQLSMPYFSFAPLLPRREG